MRHDLIDEPDEGLRVGRVFISEIAQKQQVGPIGEFRRGWRRAHGVAQYRYGGTTGVTQACRLGLGHSGDMLGPGRQCQLCLLGGLSLLP